MAFLHIVGISSQELVPEKVNVLRLRLGQKVLPLQTRKGDAEIAPYVGGVVVQVQSLQVRARGKVVLAQVGVADAQVKPPPRILRF